MSTARDAAAAAGNPAPDARNPDARFDAVCDRSGLTRRQLLIWAGDRLADGVPVFVEAAVLHLHGPLDAERFVRAWRAVVEESDALATTIVDVDGSPRRLQAGGTTAGIEVVDLARRGAPEHALEDLARERLWSTGSGSGRLVDALLVRMAPEHHAWVLVQHQLVSDSWSFRLVYERVLAHYREVPTSSPPQFDDYVAYERRLRASQQAVAARAHWQRSYSAGATGVDTVDLRAGGETTRICRVVQPLGRERTRALQAVATRTAASDFGTFVVLASVVVAHVHETTGSWDVVLSVPFANRPSARFKQTIGSFMNVCPVRVGVDAGDRVQSLRDAVASATWESARHQGYAGRAGAVPQPYDVLVNVHRAAVAAASFAACAMDVRWIAPSHRFGAVAIAVHDFSATGEMTVVVDFNEATFGATARREFLASLMRVLDDHLADPTRRRGAGASRSASHIESPAQAAGAATPWARFAAQASRTPQAVAVRANAMALTYAALRAQAERVAARLAAHDVGRDGIVAVWGVRDCEWISAMLGVWRRGAAYLPLEPRWPIARVQQVLRQSGARVVLVGPEPPAGLQARRAAGASWTLVPIGAGAASAALADVTIDGVRAENDVAAEDLAYVVYTSGSTGAPKGALIEHRGLLNHLDAKIGVLALDATDCVAQTAGAGFDISLWQCLAPLLVGGRVEILGDEVVRDPVALHAAVAARGVTVLELVPPVLELLLETDERCGAALGGLRWLIATGEPLPPELCRRWLRRYPAIPLVNAYGPTECADDVTHQVVRTLPSAEDMCVPIGRPIPGMTVHVLGEDLRALATGEIGELCVSGVGVGRGYLGEPERTATAFVIPDPFDGRAESRLYRTGDRGRRRADGALEWLGRVDAQVKIRGVRVEPAEIEGALAEHPFVRQAAVSVRASTAGGPQLVGYVVLRDDDGGAAHEADQVGEWRRLWDDTYRRQSPRIAPASFNTVGWNSSYTDRPIPDDEMREWLDGTVARIAGLRPRRVLEIGCGSGMLLCRLAPSCERYFATDLSGAAIDYVRRTHLAAGALPHVTVSQGEAHELPEGDGIPVDLVVLNSVVQYFPSADYLLRVLRAASAVLDERGAVFVGDARALHLARALHTSVELERAAEDTSVAELRARIERSLGGEGELMLDPAFFVALGCSGPRPSSVVVQLKRGRRHNELTRFRYDVVWRMGAADVEVTRALTWADGLAPAALRAMLVGDPRTSIAIRGVPNPRLQREHAAIALLAAAAPDDSVRDLRRALAGHDLGPAVDPEDFWALADIDSHDVAITWSADAADRYDVVLLPRCTVGRSTLPWIANRMSSATRVIDPSVPFAPAHDARHANDPRRRRMTAARLDEIRGFLRERLPDAMVPSRLVALDTLPLAANGKIDRDALRREMSGAPEEKGAEPQSEVELVVAGLWGQMLGFDFVGRDADFFSLGGDSLLVYRMLLAMREALAVEVSAESFLRDPTVAGLAAVIAAAPLDGCSEAEVETLLGDVEALSDEEAAALVAGDSDDAGAVAAAEHRHE